MGASYVLFLFTLPEFDFGDVVLGVGAFGAAALCYVSFKLFEEALSDFGITARNLLLAGGP
jgi:hypothetical protein